jgi:hypothetical protein
MKPEPGNILEIREIQGPESRIMGDRTGGNADINLASPRVPQLSINSGANHSLIGAERNSRIVRE